MVRRGDVDLVVDALKGYWRDKKQYPWHRILKELSNKGPKTMTDKEIAECVGLLRDGVFAALDMMSLNLALDVPTSEILDLLLKEPSWHVGRQKVRAHCANLASELIDKGKVDLLSPRGLEHDGFRFLVPALLKKRLEMLEKASPTPEEGYYDLTPLHKSILGRRLLRQLSITEKKISEDDPRVEELLTLHANLLLDLELEESSYVVDPDETTQVTLNGDIVDEEEGEEPSKDRPSSKTEEKLQVPLTEYISEEDKEKSKKEKPKKKASPKKEAKPKKKAPKKKTRKRKKKEGGEE